MKIDCINCGQRIEIGTEVCPHCENNQLQEVNKRTPMWWFGYGLLWVLEVLLLLAFILFVVVGTASLFNPIAYKTTSLSTSILILSILAIILGIPIVLVGFILVRAVKPSKHSALSVQENIQAEQPSKHRSNPLTFLNRLSHWLWSRFPITVVVILLCMIINGANELWYIEANKAYNDPSIAGHGSGRFAVMTIFSMFFFLMFVAAHSLLVLGGGVGLIVDTIRLNKKVSVGRIMPLSQRFNPLWIFLLVGLIPSLMLYSAITKPLWGPAVSIITASPEEINEGNTTNIGKYSDRKTDINTSNHQGLTPLMIAALHDDVSLTKHLLTNGADINALDRRKYSALLYAFGTRNGNAITYPLKASSLSPEQKEIIKLLIAKGADPNATAIDCSRPLKLATEAGDTEIFTLLLDAEGEIILQKEQVSPDCLRHPTLLMLASKHGHSEIISILLKEGQDINEVHTSTGNTALMYAIENAKFDTAKHLVSQGANINIKNGQDVTPLMLAARQKDANTFLSYLLEAGANIHDIAKDGTTALSEAAKSGDIGRINLLVSAGAKIDPAEKSGEQALSKAIMSNNIDIVKLFLKQGIDPNRVTTKQSPLRLAVKENNTNIVKLLLEHDANPNHPEDTDDPAILNAVSNGNKDVVLLLIEEGAEVNVTDRKMRRKSPLMAAVISQKASPEIVEILLEAGADPNIQDNYKGETALDYALNEQRFNTAKSHKVVKLLRQYGAKTHKELGKT